MSTQKIGNPTLDEIKIEIVLHMGIAQLPNRRMYW